jgi:hypothetical protein
VSGPGARGDNPGLAASEDDGVTGCKLEDVRAGDLSLKGTLIVSILHSTIITSVFGGSFNLY